MNKAIRPPLLCRLRLHRWVRVFGQSTSWGWCVRCDHTDYEPEQPWDPSLFREAMDRL